MRLGCDRGPRQGEDAKQGGRDHFWVGLSASLGPVPRDQVVVASACTAGAAAWGPCRCRGPAPVKSDLVHWGCIWRADLLGRDHGWPGAEVQAASGSRGFGASLAAAHRSHVFRMPRLPS